MPTLRFHGFESDKIKEVSVAMVKELATLCEIPEDYFNLEIIQSKFIDQGEYVAGFPIVEVHAFKREDSVEDEFAKIVCRYVQSVGYAESELYFIHLQARHYYNTGTPYA